MVLPHCKSGTQFRQLIRPAHTRDRENKREPLPFAEQMLSSLIHITAGQTTNYHEFGDTVNSSAGGDGSGMGGGYIVSLQTFCAVLRRSRSIESTLSRRAKEVSDLPKSSSLAVAFSVKIPRGGFLMKLKFRWAAMSG
jgi:hypothetical protein